MDYKDLYKQYCDELLDYYKRGLIQPRCQLESDQPFENLERVFQAIEVTQRLASLTLLYNSVSHVQYLHEGRNIGKVAVKLN